MISAGLISNVSKEIASKNAENCRCRQPHCRLTPRLQGTPANIRINLILPEETLFIVADSMDLSSFKFLLVGSKRHAFCDRVHIGRSGSSTVVDFGTNRKGVYDFLLVINSNFRPILHRF